MSASILCYSQFILSILVGAKLLVQVPYCFRITQQCTRPLQSCAPMQVGGACVFVCFFELESLQMKTLNELLICID